MKEKRFISALLCAILVMTLLPTPALAADEVAEIEGGDRFATLQEAIDAAEDDDTIILLDDVTLLSELNIPSINLTINLDGYTITGTGDKVIQYNNEEDTYLYIVDYYYGGMIKNDGDGCVISCNNGELIIGGVTIQNNSDQPAIMARWVTIDGGYVINSGSGNTIDAKNVNVYSGYVINTGSGNAISTNGDGFVDVSGGTILNTGTGFAINSDNVTVSGGSINRISSTPKNEQTLPDEVKLYTLTLPDIIETLVFEITFTPALGYDYGLTDVMTDASGKLYVWLPDTLNDASVRVTANGTDYAGKINGYEASLMEVGEPVAEIAGGDRYATLQEAIDAAVDDDTIYLLDDVTLQSELNIPSISLTIYLSGYIITGAGDKVIQYNNEEGTTLYITDSDYGGMIQNDGDGCVISCNNGELIIDGVTIQNNSDQPAIMASSVTINGSLVENSGSGNTIDAKIVNVLDSVVKNSGSGNAIDAENVNVYSGYVINSGNGNAISANGDGIVNVSGGTILNTGTGFAIDSDNVTVSGGSINRISGTPKNAQTPPVPLKLYTLTLFGVTSGIAVKSITFTPALGYDYGLRDVMTDASGKLYVWLPDELSETSINVTANETSYAGKVNGYEASLMEVGEPVAEIVGGTQHTTVMAAISAARDGATVRLLDNVTLQTKAGMPYTLTIPAINLTIDLNGKTIAGMGPTTLEYNGTAATTLYLKDSSASGGGMISNFGNYPIHSTGNVAISGGTVKSSGAPVIYTASDCTVTVSGGKVWHTGGAGTISSGNVNVKGGEVLSASGIAISAINDVEVSGGTVQSNGGAPTISGSTVKIKSGAVLGNGSQPIIVAANVEVWSGTVENSGSGNAIQATGGVTVEGGKVSSNGTSPTISSSGITVVSGGTVLNTGTGYAIGASNIIVSGGSINSMNVSPKNAATPAVEVKLYTLTLSGVSSETAVNSMTLTPALGYAYGLTGVMTDSTGKLYIWLPDAQKEAMVSISTSGKVYTGTVSNYAATLTGSSTPSTPFIAPPANTVNAAPGTNNTANASIPDDVVSGALKKALDDAAAQGKAANAANVTITINVPKGTSALSVTLSQNALQSLINAGVGSLTISGDGSFPPLTLDLKALKALQKQANGDATLKFTVPSKLSKYARKLIGDRPVFGMSASYVKRGKVRSISRLSGAGFVSIPYTLLPGEVAEHLFGVAIDSKGNTTRVRGSYYDEASGCLIIPVKSMSTMYGIGYR